MLSRGISASSGSGLMATAAGIDRGRVGERLQAALAGLHELHMLREKQGDMVTRALRADQDEPSRTPAMQSSNAARGSMLANEEQRLEATLTALKQQLSRLRRQDVGLKSHLQQLDLQISEMKLDVNKVSPDQLESDSRPSSGFYELSDGGSCSLSNSCTSVYSECLSSSQTSLLQAPVSPPMPHQPANPQPRTAGPHLGSSRIRTGTLGLERPRPRPVSTGDLDRLMTAGPGCYKSVPGKKPAPAPAPRTSTLDPKFQNSLMSRNGTEVYHYPSPLHAVALQSPIFTLAGEPCQGPPADARPGPHGPQPGQAGPETTGSLSYIDRLLQRNAIRTCVQSEEKRGAPWTRSEQRRGPVDHGAGRPGVETQAVPPQPLPTGPLDIPSLEAKWERECRPEPVTLPASGPELKCQAPLESLQRYSYPAAARDRGAAQATAASTRPPAEHSTLTRNHSESRPTDVRETRAGQRKCPAPRPVLAPSSSTEDRLGWDPRPTAPANDFVHAKFLPAGSQQVKVRQADRKTKAVKLRRKSGEKPRAPRPQQGYSSGERARESQGSGCRGDPEPRRSGKGKAGPHLGEQRGHSGSDSSLCGPGFVPSHRLHHPKPVSFPAVTKAAKGRRPQRTPEPEPPVDQRRRRQGAGRGPGDLEAFRAPCPPPRTREPYAHGEASRQTAHAASARPLSCQWAGPQRSYKPAVSASCFFGALNSRYPPAPYPAAAGGRPPARCESEYSADCASLFHSTIAASSVGDLSDDTTNRFGDDSGSSRSSASRSDSDSSLSLEEDEGPRAPRHRDQGGPLVWAQASSSKGPAVAGATAAPQRPLHPGAPPTCRIKASRALKKKIRRFQPATLKVMTLV
ncbi:dapper homolog 2 [Gadus chalcogrammus]|uniref:dapper homolog 2 n=1 Tax=Gadus chalcogrammus TaxID=1042646 RepID=UPI0024C4E0B1|nr:dapper homolog 2 [Gadus chalcogrammus]